MDVFGHRSGDEDRLFVDVWRDAVELVFEQSQALGYLHHDDVYGRRQGVEARERPHSRNVERISRQVLMRRGMRKV